MKRTMFQQFVKRPYESQLAEAATFRVLQKCDASPEVADQSGGPDFLCTRGASQFMVEATSFKTDKVTKDTSLRDEIPEETTVQAYGLLTRQIAQKVDDKHSQFAGLRMPGVLAIVSDHFGAWAVLDSYAAQCVLTSAPYWTGVSSNRMTVDFSLSGFLRLDGEQIVVHHTNISAVILITVTRYESYVCGALHPAASHRFDSRLLWEIPFVYLKDWPIEKIGVRCAGTMGNQASFAVPHARIT